MHFYTLALVACATFGVAMTDVSHLVKHYIPPPSPMMELIPTVKMAMNSKSAQSNGERVVTTIEKQELQELPTQIEYLQPGQMPYGFEVTKEGQTDTVGEKTLKLTMPKELVSSPSFPSVEEQPPTLPANKQYLAPPENERSQNSPIKENNMHSMKDSQRKQETGSAPNMSNYKQMRVQQPQQDAPSRQYLTPMSQNMKDKISEKHSMGTPSKHYLAPTKSEHEHAQEQSAPAPQYLPPQQQALDMPPQFQQYEMQQQKLPTPPSTHYNPSQTNNLKQERAFNLPQMQPSQRETLSQFGEVENVAEAAQEAIEMFDEQLLNQPLPLPNEAEPAYNFMYLPPQVDKHQKSIAGQFKYQGQSSQMAPADFVRQHKQMMMTQAGLANGAPMSFTQFHMSSTAPSLQMTSNPVAAHFLSNDGYHYHSNELNGGHNAIEFHHVTQ